MDSDTWGSYGTVSKPARPEVLVERECRADAPLAHELEADQVNQGGSTAGGCEKGAYRGAMHRFVDEDDLHDGKEILEQGS